MATFLKYFQLVVSILLMCSILVQSKNAGLSGQSSNATFQTTRRGAEKLVYDASIVLAVLFVFSSIAFLFV